MFEFKRKYLNDSLEPLAIFWLTRYYPGMILSNYLNLHSLRNLLSSIGINGFILGYAFIGLLFLFQELLIGDPAARRFMLIVFITHMIYDFLLNMEVLRIGVCFETEHYTSEFLFYKDRLTFDQRIQQLEQQEHWKEVKQVKRIARNPHDINHLQWIGGVRIREKGTGNCWLICLTDGDDYESHASRTHKHNASFYILAVFQEVRDRGLLPQRRQQVLKRLERHGVYLQPCYSQDLSSSQT